MKKRLIKRIILVVLIALLSTIMLGGCWSNIEPKSLAISSSTVYDIDEDNIYHMMVEIINTKAIGMTQGQGSASGRSSISVKGSGPTIRDAFKKMSHTIDRNIFLEHNKVRLLTKRFASNKVAMRSLLETITRDTMFDEKSLIMIIDDDGADKILESNIGLSSVVGEYLNNVYKSQRAFSNQGIFITTLEFIRRDLIDYKDPVAGVIKISKNDQIPSLNDGALLDEVKYKISVEGIAIFKDGAYVGTMDKEVATAFNLLNEEVERLCIIIPRGMDYSILEVVDPKIKVKSSIEEGNVIFDITVTGETVLSKLYSDAHEEEYASILKELEKEGAKIIEKEIEDSLNKLRDEYGVDSFCFGKYVHMDHPKQWKQMSKDWPSYYKNATFNVKFDIKISKDGEIKKPYGRK